MLWLLIDSVNSFFSSCFTHLCTENYIQFSDFMWKTWNCYVKKTPFLEKTQGQYSNSKFYDQNPSDGFCGTSWYMNIVIRAWMRNSLVMSGDNSIPPQILPSLSPVTCSLMLKRRARMLPIVSNILDHGLSKMRPSFGMVHITPFPKMRQLQD